MVQQSEHTSSERHQLADAQSFGLIPPGPLTGIGVQLCALLIDRRRASTDHCWSKKGLSSLIQPPWKTFSPLCAVNFPPVWNLASWSTPPDRARRHAHSSSPIFLVWSCSPETSKPMGQWIVAVRTPRQADSYKELRHAPHITPTKTWSERRMGPLRNMLISC